MIKKNDGKTYLKRYPVVLKESNSMTFLKNYSQRVMMNEHYSPKQSLNNQKQKQNINPIKQVSSNNCTKIVNMQALPKQLRNVTQRMQDIMEELYQDNQILKRKCDNSYRQQPLEKLGQMQNIQNRSHRAWVHKRSRTYCDSDDIVQRLQQLTQRNQLRIKNDKQNLKDQSNNNQKRTQKSCLIKKANKAKNKIQIGELPEKSKEIQKMKQSSDLEDAQYRESQSTLQNDKKFRQSTQTGWNRSLGVDLTNSQLVQNTESYWNQQQNVDKVTGSRQLELEVMKQQLQQKNKRIIQLECLLWQTKAAKVESNFNKKQHQMEKEQDCNQMEREFSYNRMLEQSGQNLQQDVSVKDNNDSLLIEEDSLNQLNQNPNKNFNQKLQNQIKIIICSSQQELQIQQPLSQQIGTQYDFLQFQHSDQLFIISQESLSKSQHKSTHNQQSPTTIKDKDNGISFIKINHKSKLHYQSALQYLTIYPIQKYAQEMHVQTDQIEPTINKNIIDNQTQTEINKSDLIQQQQSIQNDLIISSNMQLSQKIIALNRQMVEASLETQKTPKANKPEMNQQAVNTDQIDKIGKIEIQIQVNCDFFEQTVSPYYRCVYPYDQ